MQLNFMIADTFVVKKSQNDANRPNYKKIEFNDNLFYYEMNCSFIALTRTTYFNVKY